MVFSIVRVMPSSALSPTTVSQMNIIVDFLRRPRYYIRKNPTQKKAIKKLVKVNAIQLRQGAKVIEQQTFQGTHHVKDIREYVKYRRLLKRIYKAGYSLKSSKYLCVEYIAEKNWLTPKLRMGDYDYSQQVLQLLQWFNDVNLVKADPNLPSTLKNQLDCITYAVAFELAGKKLAKSAKLLTGNNRLWKMSEILSILKGRKLNFTKHFDNDLRNGLYHQSYLIDGSKTPPEVAYSYTKIKAGKTKNMKKRVTMLKIIEKTFGIIAFLYAFLHVNALEFASASFEALALVP
jgi:hypothetical protein